MGYEKFDLNLFALFDTMMKQRSVSAAGRELGVTASAVSHGLGRLRRLLGDELFVAGPTGMQPTPRAAELAPSIQDGLGKLALALENRPFDPAEATRTFVIAASDYTGSVLLPEVVRRVSQQAPHVHLKVFPFGRMEVVRLLDEDRLQIVLGWFDTLPQRIHRRKLLTEYEAIVVRAGHPLTTTTVTNAKILSFPSVVVELTGSETLGNGGFLNDRGVLRRVWIERLLIQANTGQDAAVGHVAVTVPHFAEVPRILNATDMVATLPRRLALQAVERDGLVMLDLPYEPLTVRWEMICHERAAVDPGLRWLTGQIEAAAAALPDV